MRQITVGADVGTNLIDGHVLRREEQIGEEGADVGTNLIDGHFWCIANKTQIIGCRRRHQPDRRTP